LLPVTRLLRLAQSRPFAASPLVLGPKALWWAAEPGPKFVELGFNPGCGGMLIVHDVHVLMMMQIT